MPSSEVKMADVEVAPDTKSGEPKGGLLTRPAGWTVCLSLLLAVAVLRIVATYHVFNHTIDEPSHIACGVEWWQKGVYRIETKHTPLARICVALGPYLAGVRGTGATNWRETYPILSANGHYWENLTLGRIGVLPFLVIATVVVFFWTRRLFGAPAGLIAAAVFTQLPTVLAHSAVATTDIPFTAMFCFALYRFTLWLNAPRARTAVLFGVATGLALTAKLSTVVFLPACAIAILAMYTTAGRCQWGGLVRGVALVVMGAFVVTWAVYRFSYAPLSEVTTVPDRVAVRIFGSSSPVIGAVHAIDSYVPVPAPELIDGIRILHNQVDQGSRGYLFGQVKQGGWWYFFFVALAVKTPIAVLLLALLGTVVIAIRYWQNWSDWEIAVPVAAAALVMIVTMPSPLDSGVRYVMPMFVFLSILAALGLTTLWSGAKHRFIGRGLALVLFAWFTVSSALSHPDYLAYFNEFAGRDPSRLIVVGDLDWGQDLARLSGFLRDHSVKHVTIAYDGYYVPQALGLPETEHLRCGDEPTGWVAMELRRARLYPECYPWLAQEHAIAKVGKTMSVYYMKP